LIPARSVKGNWLLVLSVGAIIISVAFIGVAYVALSPKEGGTMYGTLFVNEAGVSNSTADIATASYNATLTATNGNGQILFTFLSGTDLVQNDLVSISNYTISVNQISMTIGGHSIVMPWEDNDSVWAGQFDNNYIASWGPSAPGYELRGQVSPSVFGLPLGDYVEFRFAAAGGEPSDDCC
jgi:hypothetical protein